MAKRLLVGNWKMNLGAEQAKQLVSSLLPLSSSLQKSEVWIAAPAVHLSALSSLARGSALKLGAQNVHWEKSGAFTGEISASMLKELGLVFSLAGHSERRHLFAESDELAARRCLVATQDFTVIFCVGETLAEREARQTEAVLARQLGALFKISPPGGCLDSLLIAYEPVWAIGTGKVAGSAEISSAHSFIDSFWREQSGNRSVPILYGGSVAPDNFGEISQIPLVAGGLVGGASLSAEKFGKLIELSEA